MNEFKEFNLSVVQQIKLHACKKAFTKTIKGGIKKSGMLYVPIN